MSDQPQHRVASEYNDAISGDDSPADNLGFVKRPSDEDETDDESDDQFDENNEHAVRIEPVNTKERLGGGDVSYGDRFDKIRTNERLGAGDVSYGEAPKAVPTNVRLGGGDVSYGEETDIKNELGFDLGVGFAHEDLQHTDQKVGDAAAAQRRPNPGTTSTVDTGFFGGDSDDSEDAQLEKYINSDR